MEGGFVTAESCYQRAVLLVRTRQYAQAIPAFIQAGRMNPAFLPSREVLRLLRLLSRKGMKLHSLEFNVPGALPNP
jgi:hypothetical protein